MWNALGTFLKTYTMSELNCWSPFGKNKVPSRWAILTGCLLFMTLSGALYAFGLISQSINVGAMVETNGEI